MHICIYIYICIYVYIHVEQSEKSTDSSFPGHFFQITNAHTIQHSTMSDFYSMIKLNCRSPGNQPLEKSEFFKSGKPSSCPGNQPPVRETNPSQVD